jgi:glycosyltransferase involved in cell wall biosynthesis
MGQGATSISVVICAYDLERWKDLTEAVQSCQRQTLAPDQVIVVVDHNEELHQKALLQLDGALVLANRFANGLSGARHTGVGCATGEVIAFLDDDARAEASWLEHLTAPLSDQSIAGVGGWITPRWDSPPPGWFPDAFYWVIGCSYPDLPPTNAQLRNPFGANMAMRRRVFTQVGGFLSGLGRIGKVPLGCEETEISVRYTNSSPDERFVMVREAIVHHRVPASRLTWHYCWTRCWAEGISKAVVTSLVGSATGLASERGYALRTLPRAVIRSLRRLPDQPGSALGQVAAIVAGTSCAAAGLVWGRLSLRRHPIGLAHTRIGDADLGIS